MDIPPKGTQKRYYWNQTKFPILWWLREAAQIGQTFIPRSEKVVLHTVWQNSNRSSNFVCNWTSFHSKTNLIKTENAEERVCGDTCWPETGLTNMPCLLYAWWVLHVRYCMSNIACPRCFRSDWWCDVIGHCLWMVTGQFDVSRSKMQATIHTHYWGFWCKVYIIKVLRMTSISHWLCPLKFAISAKYSN